MERKGKVALLLAGVFVFGSGFTVKINREQSETFASRIIDYSENMEDDSFDIAAHRGFSSLEVENTEEALSLAAKKNYVDTIEMDARRTSDGKFVLSHNDTLFISSDSTVDVSSLSYDQAMNQIFYYGTISPSFSIWRSSEKNFLVGRYLQLNGREYHLTDLLDGIRVCDDKNILLDIKFNGDVEVLVEELMEELKGVDTSNIIFQSLDIEGIRYLRDHSNYRCLALISRKSDLQYIDEFDAVGVKSSLLSPEIVQKILTDGKKLALWTIDSTQELNRVVDILGDAYQDVIYITDYPDLIATALHEKKLVKK